ncbi:MAG: hypothetical protein JXJ04_18460 [Spirochaetales bacterium]|nr:hypothetical protein [Spirochaetales bacterium]
MMIAINFDNLIERIPELKTIMEKGEEIILEDEGHPIAKIIPFHQPKKRKLGGEAGKIWISEDFTEPLPEDILEEFYKVDKHFLIFNRRRLPSLWCSRF